jgi:hypothetical protein
MFSFCTNIYNNNIFYNLPTKVTEILNKRIPLTNNYYINIQQ